MKSILDFIKDRPYTFIWKLCIVFLLLSSLLYLIWYKQVFAPKYNNPHYYTGTIVGKIEGKNRSNLSFLAVKWDRPEVYGSVSTGPVLFHQYKVGDRIGVGYEWHPILKMVKVGDVPVDPNLPIPMVFFSLLYAIIFYGFIAFAICKLIIWYAGKMKEESCKQ